MSAESFMRPGAVDLSSLAARSRPPAAAGNGAVASVVVDVTDATFEAEVLTRSLTVPVVIDLWAEWCGPCKMIAPILDEVSESYKDKLQIAKMNVDENRDVPAKFGIRGIPTLMLFKDGNVQASKLGMMSKPQLTAFLDSNI